MSVPAGTPIHRIEGRLILPTLHVPDPSNERYEGAAILHSILNTRQHIGRGSPSTRGGAVGVHWSTNRNVPTSYDFDTEGLEKTQSGVPLSNKDIRTMRATNKNDETRDTPRLYSDLSGSAGTAARPFSTSVIWHGSVVNPEHAKNTDYTWEHEVDLTPGSQVSVHGFSYHTPQPGQPHMGRQFTRVNLPDPVMMTVATRGQGSNSINEIMARQRFR